MAEELNNEFDTQVRAQKHFVDATAKKVENHQELNDREIVVYTSGYGGLFRSGLAVGKIIKDKKTKKNIVNFFSDFRQLDYVKIVSYEIGSGN